jgi:hypothetical protein
MLMRLVKDSYRHSRSPSEQHAHYDKASLLLLPIDFEVVDQFLVRPRDLVRFQQGPISVVLC